MKKLQKQEYRVECNFGSKYFKSMDKAMKYFEDNVSEYLYAELWLVTYIYSPKKKIYSAKQELLGYSASVLAKF